MKEKILILGASSYIGENLLFFLKKEKYKVFCTYNKNYKTIFKYFTSIKLNIEKVNILSFPENISTIIVLLDTTPENQKDLNKYLNFLKKLKNYLLWNNIKKIIYISSGSVYEADKKKLSLNAKSKIIGEKIFLYNKNQFKTVILRIFFPYGKNQKNRMIPNLVNNLMSKHKINILQNSYKIYPTHVNDIVKVIIKVMKNKNLKGIFNVYNSKERMSMHDICKMILGKKIISKLFNFKKIKNLRINHTHKNLLKNSNIKLFQLEHKKLLR